MRLHFRSYGAGPPLIILHGLFGSHENWHSTSVSLAEQFHVFAVDQRNHGQSDHSPEMTYPLMAKDLAEFMDSAGLPQANVLGHSMGGKTSMQFALSFPSRVDKLVVVDIGPQAYPARHEPIISALLALDIVSTSDRRQLEHALAHEISDHFTRQFLLKSLKRDRDGRFYWQLGLNEIDRNYGHLGEAIAGQHSFVGPALFIRGEKSDYLSPGDLPRIQRLFPRAEMRTIAQATHLPHVENQTAFRAVLNAFLRPQFSRQRTP